MTDIGESRVPGMGAVIAAQNRLLTWLRDGALPLWDEYGVDRVSGGYFETINCAGPDGLPEASGDVRRGRVVARQLYVFDIGHALGWRSRFSSPVEHGCEYLFARLYRGDGIFHSAVDATTHRPMAGFSLYEHAFYLFALARLSSTQADRYPVRQTALRCLQQLRATFGKPGGGFEESTPATLPLKSNPHMHLLEAALAWIKVETGPAQLQWLDLARELVSLCLVSFVDPTTGAIREYFDHDWLPMKGDAGRLIEPGHQFEWAWLLLQWASSGQCDSVRRRACEHAAYRLVALAEEWGVDASRGAAVNEMWDDMSVKVAAAKLWPQTERIKAWCAMLASAHTVEAAERACQGIAAAARGLESYFKPQPAGLWHEIWGSAGDFEPGPSKASSLYHVVCGIDVLRQTVIADHNGVLYSSSTNVTG